MSQSSILVIDDDIVLLKSVESVLSQQYAVSVCKNAAQALRLLERDVFPDLILLDINMPDIDGYELLDKIRTIKGCERIPVIFLTGYSDASYEVRGLNAGAVDYITKPFSSEILLARINRHLEEYEKGSGNGRVGLSQQADEIKSLLTPTEWAVANAIAQGLDNKEIAQQTHYSYGYIKNIAAKIYSKLNIKNRRELYQLFRK